MKKSMAPRLLTNSPSFQYFLEKGIADTNIPQGTAVHECVSEEALVHLKSYKYSSVDRSLLSYYVLNPYV